MSDEASIRVRVGVGGWTFEPWRDNFYPAGWPHARELEYMSRKLTAIEINSTYYSSQKPQTYRKWRDDTPDGFVFSLKASRFATNRRVLAEAGESVQRFVHGGLEELAPKLGPIVWQFATSKRFDAADFEAFLELLPAEVNGIRLRHAMDVRHDSFKCSEYLALARRHGVATVFTDSDGEYPAFADITGDFVYTRVMRCDPALPHGLPPATLASIASCAQAWRAGGEPDALPRIEPRPDGTPAKARDVFVYFISEGKEKAPAAAMGLIEALGGR